MTIWTKKNRLLITACLLFSAFCVYAQNVAIVLSGDYSDFRKARNGIINTFIAEYPDANISEYYYRDKDREKLFSSIVSIDPILIFTIGNSATLFAKKDLSKFPIVFSMVYSPEKYGIAGSGGELDTNIAGVAVDVDKGIIMKHLLDIFGENLTIEAVYSEQSFFDVKSIEEKAERKNITFISYLVPQAVVLNKVLKKVKKKSIFWILPDPMIYTSATLRETMETLNRSGAIILAPTIKFLRMNTGAHVAISIDPEENGMQAGRLGIQLMTSPQGVSRFSGPEKYRIFVKKGTTVRDTTDIIWVE